MKNIFLSLIAFVLLIVMSCGSDDPEPKNSPPNAFTVTVSNIQSNQADISWTVAVDPDDDEVTYLITGTTGFTGSETLTTNSETSGTLSGLVAETAYAGEVSASDGNEGVTTAPFSFTTTQ